MAPLALNEPPHFDYHRVGLFRPTAWRAGFHLGCLVTFKLKRLVGWNGDWLACLPQKENLSIIHTNSFPGAAVQRIFIFNFNQYDRQLFVWFSLVRNRSTESLCRRDDGMASSSTVGLTSTTDFTVKGCPQGEHTVKERGNRAFFLNGKKNAKLNLL